MSTERLSSHIVYAHTSWRLDEEEWRLENGRLVQKPAVRHPGSVVLIPLRQTERGPEILMIRQFRYVLNKTIFELPAGTQQWDEAPLQCAQRELREETGFQAKHFINLGSCWASPGSSDERETFFLATDLSYAPLPADEDEQIELAPILFSDLYQQAKMGHIQDAKTVVAVWKTAVYLEKSKP